MATSQKKPQIINATVIKSIPLCKSLKRYYTQKFNHLVEHNGVTYASDVFKQLRLVVMSYIADPQRIRNRESYIAEAPVRKNGWLYKLFAYADTQPEYTLNFLKLYVGLGDPIIGVNESAAVHAEYLRTREYKPAASVLKHWCEFVGLPLRDAKKMIDVARATSQHPLHQAVRHHSTYSLLQYQQKWRRIFISNQGYDSEWSVTPEMYCDYRPDGRDKVPSSTSFEEDLYYFLQFHISCGGNGYLPTGVSPEFTNWILGRLNPGMYTLVEQVWTGQYTVQNPDILRMACVGQIHHIPKSGTVDRRPIAVPNRFVQAGLEPAASYLYGLLEKAPQDATFNQDRFDSRIVYRMSKRLYVGSVDLSKATDNLPLSWFDPIWDLIKTVNTVPDEVEKSFRFFKAVAKAQWLDGTEIGQWKCGQPLGTKPSFAVLGLTHNCICEALSFFQGYLHSPYAILGDDLVVFSKRLRKRYIELFTSFQIPLSLHKSFENRMVEFAGKIFVSGLPPFYNSDHRAIHWSSLFDYSRSTGINIQWDALPRTLRKRMETMCTEAGLPGYRARSVYQLCLKALSVNRGSHKIIVSNESDLKTLELFFEYMAAGDDPQPDQDSESGIINGSAITVAKTGWHFYPIQGQVLRGSKKKVQDWFRVKYRPASSDKIVRCMVLAMATRR